MTKFVQVAMLEGQGGFYMIDLSKLRAIAQKYETPNQCIVEFDAQHKIELDCTAESLAKLAESLN